MGYKVAGFKLMNHRQAKHYLNKETALKKQVICRAAGVVKEEEAGAEAWLDFQKTMMKVCQIL